MLATVSDHRWLERVAEASLHTDLGKVDVDITVVLGEVRMPIHKLLRMGRGAVIELASTESDTVHIHANGHPFALGQVIVSANRIQVEIIELLMRPPHHPRTRDPGP